MGKKIKAKTPPAPSSSNPLVSVLIALVALAYGVWKFSPIFLKNEAVEGHIYDKGIFRDQTIFEVVDYEGKGKGMKALRNIEQGELILREKPLILMPPEVSKSFLPKKLRSLGNSSYHAFATLSHGELPPSNLFSITSSPDAQPHTELRDIATDDDLQELALSVLNSNGIELNGELVGLFPRLSRMNHACGGSGGFNAVHSWRADYVGSGELFVHAMTEIKKGDEITLEYIDTRQKREDRIKQLQESYGFTCSCPICSLPKAQSEESDRRLTRMGELYSELSQWKEGEISGRKAIEAGSLLLSFALHQQYWHDRGKISDEICEIAAANADERLTRDWANSAKTWYKLELGEDHFLHKKMASIAENPKSHPNWGSRKEKDWDS